jgi:uracil phosphoribosyltransferase
VRWYVNAAAPEGIRAVCAAYPEVGIVVSEVDPGLNDKVFSPSVPPHTHARAHTRLRTHDTLKVTKRVVRPLVQKKVSPGIGDFADRYFCTED